MSEEKKQEEGSTVAAIKGFSAPVGTVTRKKAVDEEMYEMALALSEMEGKKIREVVRKRGSVWVIYDDDTEAEIGAYKDRDTAWERQRYHRNRKRIEKQQQKSAAKTLSAAKKSEKSSEKKTKPTKKESKDSLKNLMKQVLISENFLSYVFEQPQGSEDSVAWDRFLASVSRESIMSDQKLKNILTNLAKSELKLLKSALEAVKKSVERTGSFKVSGVKMSQKPGESVVDFAVEMKDNKKKLPFSIKIENARPLIHLPDQTKSELNTMANDESKLLRAELIHVQEAELDNMDDVVQASAKRDSYLRGVEGKLDKIVGGLGPLEIAVLKNLVKVKYKGVK